MVRSLPFPLTWKEATSGEANLLPKLILQRYCHEFKKKLRYLFPVSFSQSRITNDLQQWNVNFKLVHLTFDTISHSSGAWGITKCLGQFQYCSVHATNFLLNLLCIYVRKWTFKAKTKQKHQCHCLVQSAFRVSWNKAWKNSNSQSENTFIPQGANEDTK